jgi:hypothetical protein
MGGLRWGYEGSRVTWLLVGGYSLFVNVRERVDARNLGMDVRN